MDPAAVLNIVVNAQTGKAVAEIQAVGAQLKKTAGTSAAATGRIAKAAKWGGAALAVGVVAGLVKSVNAAKEFESSFAEVRKTVDASEKGFDRLESGLRRLSRTIPINVNELNDLAGQAGALGVASKDIVRFTRTAAELGIATDLSASEAANALARLSNIMGTSSKDFRRLGSSFVALGNDGASTEQEIAAMALRLAATGKQVGLNEAQVLSFSSALASVGIEAEAGGSAFSRAFSMMSQSVATNSEELAKFAKVAGMGSGQFAGLFSENAAAAMVAFIEGLGRVKREGGNALVVLEDLGITEIRLRNALLSAAGAGKLFREQLKTGSEAWKENNALTREANQRYNTTEAKFGLLGNRANDLAITIGQKLDPVVKGLLDSLLAVTSGDTDKWLSRMSKRSQTASDAVDALKGAWKVFGPVVGAIIEFARDRIQVFLQIIRSIAKVFKGVVHLVSGVVTGDWRKAWDGVKMIASGAVGVVKATVKGMLAPLKATFNGLRKIMANVFGSAWETVERIFRDGKNAVIDIVNSIIGVLNRIPGVDIGKIPNDLSGSGSYDANPHKGKGFQRGGPIYGGKPSGDSVPALLERGEYVLNRNAVRAVGKKQLDAVNFGMASRFQVGGPVGMIGGGIADTAAGLASDAVGAAGDVLGKSAGWFIGKLPKPNLPEPFTGTGPWLIRQVEEWIKGKVPKAGVLGNLPGSLGAAMEMARQFGLTITSTLRPGDTDSFHGIGRAFDASNGVNTPEMMSYAKAAAARWGSRMLEMFYDPLGWFIDNGQKFPGAIGGHSDHVHVAMQRGGLVGGILRLISGGAVVRAAAPILTRKGFDHKATAGIMGNAWGESTWNPAAMEPGTDNGGLFGFTAYEKSLANMRAYAAARGKPWTDVGAQIGFMLHSGGMSLRGRLNALDSIPDTTKLFMDEYERPGIPRLEERIKGGFMASEIMRGMKLGPPGSGGGMSDKERAKAQRKARRESREEQVGKMLKRALSAKSSRLKKGTFWQILDMYAKYGEFGVSKGGMFGGGVAPGGKSFEAVEFLRRASGIASITDPQRGAGQLYSLVRWLQENVPMTGVEDANDRLSGKLERVKDRGTSRAEKKRKTILSAISKKGLDFPHKKRLLGNDRIIRTAEEWIELAERDATSESSPGGSDYTDAEVDYQTRLYKSLLGTLRERRGLISRSMVHVAKQKERLEEQLKVAPAWKRSGIRKAIGNARSTLFGPDGLRSGMEELVGLTGRGGRIGEVRAALADLGVTQTVEGHTSEQVASLLREQLAVANLNNAILTKQIPIFQRFGADYVGAFAQGGTIPRSGVALVGERGPELAEFPGGTRIHPNGSLRSEPPIVVIEIAEGAGVDPNMIDARINGQLAKVVRKNRTGGPAAGRNYVTSG